MTVFIDNAEFTQRLQRERDELLAENRKLRKELETLRKLSDLLTETPMPWCEECQCYHHETAGHIEKLGNLFDWDEILKGQEK